MKDSLEIEQDYYAELLNDTLHEALAPIFAANKVMAELFGIGVEK